MTDQTFPGLNASDYNYLKCWVAIIRSGNKVFSSLFTSAFDGKNKSVRDYIYKDLGCTNNKLKQIFDKDQKRKIDEDVVGEYDISLYYILLQNYTPLKVYDKDLWKSKDSKPKLLYLLYRLKNKRNEYSHGYQTVNVKPSEAEIEDIKSLLLEILDEAQNTLNTSDFSQIKDIVHKDITAIKDSPIPVNSEDLEEIKRQKIKILMQEAKSELNESYNNQTQILLPLWPVSDKYQPIKDIYVDNCLTLCRYDKMRNQITSVKSKVSTSDLLNVKKTDGSTPGLILVAGDSGMGKTTLLKHIIYDWMSGENKVEGTEDYDLVLYLDCRGCQHDSIETALTYLIPKTTAYFNYKELLSLIFSLKLLVIFDNLNEISSRTLHIFDELLLTKVKIVATTNFKVANEIVQKAHSKIPLRLELEGVSRENLVSKLQSIVPDNENKEIDTSLFLNKCLTYQLSEQNNNIQSPEVLTHLFYHWISPQNDNSTPYTVTDLFLKSQDIFVRKIKEKVQIECSVPLNECSALQIKVEKFICYLGTVAIKTLHYNSIDLTFDHVNELYNHCKALGLPAKTLLGELLCFQGQIDFNMPQICPNVSFPSKSMQEFYCANHVCSQLKNYSSVIIDIKDLLIRNGNKVENLTRIQSTLKFLIGILNVTLKDELIKRCSEITQLLKQTGINKSIEWLTYVEEAKSCKELIVAVRNEMDDSWCFDDYYISEGIKSLMDIRPPEDINLTTCEDPSNINHLKNIINVCFNTPAIIFKLHIYHHFWKEKSNTSDEYIDLLLSEKPKCSLISFAGRLSNAAILHLPPSIQRLALHITPENIETLNNLLPKMTNLKMLYLNFDITSNIPSSAVTKLSLCSDHTNLALDLWKVQKDCIDWSWDVIKNLSLTYSRISLRQACMTADNVNTWIEGLNERKIAIGAITIGSSVDVTNDELSECRKLANKIHCSELKWLKL